MRWLKIPTPNSVTVLDWPANSPDLKPIENLDERHQTQQCRWPEAHREYMGYCEEEDAICQTQQCRWPEAHREYMGYCLVEDERHQTQQCRRAEGHYQSNLGFITPEQCHRLIDSMPCHIDAVIHAKRGPTKYWEHRNELFWSLTFLFKISLFYSSYVIFQFSETLNFGFSLSVSHNHQNSKK